MIDLGLGSWKKSYSSVVRNIYLLRGAWIFYDFRFANFSDFVLNNVQTGFWLYHILDSLMIFQKLFAWIKVQVIITLSVIYIVLSLFNHGDQILLELSL